MTYPMRYFIYLKCTSTSQSPELQCQLRVIQKFKFQVCFMPIISCISWDTKFSINHFYCGVKSSIFYCSQETLILWIDKGNMKLFNILTYFYSHTETCRNMQYWVNVLISFNSFITNAVILLGITRQIFKYRGFPFLLLTVDGNHSWQYSHPHSTIYLKKTTTF